MKIERIYILYFKGDVRRARCCVASIRQWYPDIPISLIKDELVGAFDTRDMERYWGVDVFPAERKRIGFGLGKLEPLFQPRAERCLILDSDTVFVGPLLEELERWDDDFLVDLFDFPPDMIREFVLDLDLLAAAEPDFKFPGFVFNTGSLVATTGILTREDFESYVVFDQPVQLRRPDIFKAGDQGILNFVLLWAAQEGRITLRRVPMSRWPGAMPRGQIDVGLLSASSPYRFLLHWSGPKNALFTASPMGHVLGHFEAAYYARIPRGQAVRLFRRADNLAGVATRRWPWKGYRHV